MGLGVGNRKGNGTGRGEEYCFVVINSLHFLIRIHFYKNSLHKNHQPQKP